MSTHIIKTKPWGNPEKAKLLVIGHDPRLQDVDTIANYGFFADYYFQPKPSKGNDFRKYGLAESLYTCIRNLTHGFFSDNDLLITNLCNEALPASPKHKTVYISRDKAKEGLQEIRALLTGSNVKLIFAMSEQVNYWLQLLGFYSGNSAFLEKAEPKETGVNNQPPYYEHKVGRAFTEICGHKYVADGRYYLFPILHVKRYPLTGKFLVYKENYEHCRKEVRELINSLKEKDEL